MSKGERAGEVGLSLAISGGGVASGWELANQSKKAVSIVVK